MYFNFIKMRSSGWRFSFQREGEQVLAFGFNQDDATAFRLLFGGKFHRFRPFPDFCADDTSVDVRLAAMTTEASAGRGKEVVTVEWF